jgi:hypothetical protein
VQDAAEARLVVAHHGVRDERCGYEQPEQGQDQRGLRDHERSVDVHIAALAADGQLVGSRGTEGHQQEHCEGHPERRRAQLITQLEGGDMAQHDGVLRRPAAARRA